MASITYKCIGCEKKATLETEGATIFMMDDNVPRPPTYVVQCPHCGKKNSVAIKNE